MSRLILRNVSNELAECIGNSKTSIFISTSILTNYDLLTLLRFLCFDGVSITIIMSDNLVNKSLDFTDYMEAGGKIYIKNKGKYLNSNFYIFDRKKTITGTITCSYSSHYKNEELAVVSEDLDLVRQLENKFKHLLKKSEKYNRSLFKTPLNFENNFVDLEDRLEKSILKEITYLQKKYPNVKFDFLFVVLERAVSINAVKLLSEIDPSNIEQLLVKMYDYGLTKFSERGKSYDSMFWFLLKRKVPFTKKQLNRYTELKENEIDKGYVKFVELWRKNRLDNLFEKIKDGEFSFFFNLQH